MSVASLSISRPPPPGPLWRRRSPPPPRPRTRCCSTCRSPKAGCGKPPWGLLLLCHSSYRGVVEFYRDLLNVNLSVGTVHNIVREAIAKARPYNLGQDLAAVDI